jgi:penicillin-binding protein 1A
VAEALADHPDNDELRSAVVLEASPRKVVAVLQSGDTITVTGEGLRPVTSGLADKAGPRSRSAAAPWCAPCERQGRVELTQLPEVEGALVALDPRTGAIRALVGGFDFGKSKFNHVTQAWRQPGSSFKPFIYSAALEKGFTPATVVNDAPLFFDADETGSQPWEPKNYDGKFEGPMPLHTALAKSKNMVSIRVLQAIGPAFAQEWIRTSASSRQAPGLPDDGAGRRLGHAAADGHRLQRVRQWRLPPVSPHLIARHRQQGPRAAGEPAARVLDDESARTLPRATPS